MICKECGKDFGLVYPPIVNARLQKKATCIECEKWINLIDEVQINPLHIVLDGVYLILEENSSPQHSEENCLIFRNLTFDKTIFANNYYCAGAIPEKWKTFFPDNSISEIHYVEELYARNTI